MNDTADTESVLRNGLKAGYRILESGRPADDLVLGYLDVEFTYSDRDPLPVHLGVMDKRDADDRYICYYQVSRGI